MDVGIWISIIDWIDELHCKIIHICIHYYFLKYLQYKIIGFVQFITIPLQDQ